MNLPIAKKQQHELSMPRHTDGERTRASKHACACGCTCVGVHKRMCTIVMCVKGRHRRGATADVRATRRCGRKATTRARIARCGMAGMAHGEIGLFRPRTGTHGLRSWLRSAQSYWTSRNGATTRVASLRAGRMQLVHVASYVAWRVAR